MSTLAPLMSVEVIIQDFRPAGPVMKVYYYTCPSTASTAATLSIER